MYTEGKTNARVGKVAIQTHRGSYRVRFTYPKGKRHQFIVAPVNDKGWITALRVAHEINVDIEKSNVDLSYARYTPVSSNNIELLPKKIDLLQIWGNYKIANQYKNAVTTQIEPWRQTDSCLAKVSNKALQLNQTDLLFSELLKIYSVGTLERVFANLKAACYLSLKKGEIERNPFIGFKLPKRVKKQIECYESDEIKVILEAFKSNEFVSKYARVKHSYYYPYVKFVALTFCRPEDAIALTWSDIKTKSNGTFIVFSRAYSRGILKDGKTHEIRVFKCNQELIDLISSIPQIHNEHNLLFPTPRKGSYLNQRAWGRDVWKPLVTKLANLGKVHKYLKFYSLRHSGITRLVRSSYDVATIARLAGTSPEVILNNYLMARENIDLPTL